MLVKEIYGGLKTPVKIIPMPGKRALCSGQPFLATPLEVDQK